MKTSPRPDFAELLRSALAVALVVLVLGPTGSALAAESGATEPSAEPAPPPSNGWVPEDGGEPSEGEGERTSQGSAIGSGGSGSKPAPPPVAEPEASPTPAPSPEPEYDEPDPESAPTAEESLSPLPPETADPPAPAPKPDPFADSPQAIGQAVAVASAEPRQGVLGVNAESAPAAAVPAASAVDSGSSGLGTVRLLVIVLCGCVLIVAGARVVLGPVEPNWPGRAPRR